MTDDAAPNDGSGLGGNGTGTAVSASLPSARVANAVGTDGANSRSTTSMEQASHGGSGKPDSALRKAARGFSAALFSSAYMNLAVATTVTIVVYLLPSWDSIAQGSDGHSRYWDRYLAVALGVVGGLLMGGAYAWFLACRNAAELLNPRQYAELAERWATLDAQASLYCPHGGGGNGSDIQRGACIEIMRHRKYIRNELRPPEADDGSTDSATSLTKWFLGTGYVDIWKRLHDTEIALFALQRREQVVASGLFDELRITGAGMTNEPALLARLRAAVTILGGKDYIPRDVVAEKNALDVTETDRSSASEFEARLLLADIRRALNDVRDESRAGLVRTRNHLVWTGLVTVLVCYVLVALTVLEGADKQSVVAAATYFLVGALVGLFAQLRSSSRSAKSGEDDFGLARARMVYTPILSGLAALGGVLVLNMLAPTLVTTLAVANGGAGATGNATAASQDLHKIFSLRENTMGLVVAAVFGLTPDLLISRLQGQADRYKADLANTTVQTRNVR